MGKNTAEETIKELQAQIDWLRDHAHDKLDEIEKAHPELGENELFEHYKAEGERALDGLNAASVVVTLQRSFLELRRKKSGYNRDHLGGA